MYYKKVQYINHRIYNEKVKVEINRSFLFNTATYLI